MTVMTLRKALDVVPLIEGAGEGNGAADRLGAREHERIEPERRQAPFFADPDGLM